MNILARRWKVVAALAVACSVPLFLLVIFFGLQHRPFQSGEGVVFTGAGANIIMHGFRDGVPLKGPEELWTPSHGDIERMEVLLRTDLDARQKKHPEWPLPLKSYRRQYVGYIKNGREFIYISASDSSLSHTKEWKEVPIVIADGNYVAFRLIYDVKSGQFSKFEINSMG